MRRLFLLFCVAIGALTATSADFVTIHCEKAGTLDERTLYVTSPFIKLTGEMDGHDLGVLSPWLAKCVSELDMSELTIKSSSESSSANFVKGTYFCDSESYLWLGSPLSRILSSRCLRRLVLPKSCIGFSDMYWHSGLTKIEVPSGSDAFCSVDGVIYTKDMKTLVCVPPHHSWPVDVPASVERVRPGAFRNVKCSYVRFRSSKPVVFEVDSDNKLYAPTCAYVIANNVANVSEAWPDLHVTSKLNDEVVTINTTASGRMTYLLGMQSTPLADINRLKVSGTLDGNDIEYMLSLPKLHYLDLSEAEFDETNFKYEWKARYLCDFKFPRLSAAIERATRFTFTAPCFYGEIVIPDSRMDVTINAPGVTAVAGIKYLNVDGLYNTLITSLDLSDASEDWAYEISGYNSNLWLTDVKLPKSIKSIGGLNYCPLTHIELPEGITYVKSLGWHTTSLEIPSTVYFLVLESSATLSKIDFLSKEYRNLRVCMSYLPCLEAVDLSNVWNEPTYNAEGDYLRSWIRNTGVKSVKFSPTSVNGDVAYCPYLKELDYSHCYGIKSLELRKLNKGFAEVIKLPATLEKFTASYDNESWPSLKKVVCASLTPPDNGMPLSDVEVVVPNNCKDVYKAHDTWGTAKSISEGGYSIGFTTSIKDPLPVWGGGLYLVGQEVAVRMDTVWANQMQYTLVDFEDFLTSEVHPGNKFAFTPTRHTMFEVKNDHPSPTEFKRAGFAFGITSDIETEIPLELKQYSIDLSKGRLFDENGTLEVSSNPGKVALKIKPGLNRFALVNSESVFFHLDPPANHAEGSKRIKISNIDYGSENDGTVNFDVFSIDGYDVKGLDLSKSSIDRLFIYNSDIETLDDVKINYSPVYNIYLNNNAHLKDISLSDCPKLTWLDLKGCTALKSISLGQSPDLQYINLDFCTSLPKLTLSRVPRLRSITLRDCSSLAELDLSDMPALSYLSLGGGKGIEKVSLTDLPALEGEFWIYEGKLKEANFCNLSRLEKINLPENQLTSLDISQMPSLKSLTANSNQLTTISVAEAPALERLGVGYNKLTELKVTGFPALKELYVNENQLTELDLSSNPLLEKISISTNMLTELDLSKNQALVSVQAYNNKLTELDLSKMPSLKEAYLSNNKLKSLDVSGASSLEALEVWDNKLRFIDLSGTPALKKLVLSRNELRSLDVSESGSLETLQCHSNYLSDLKVPEGFKIVVSDVVPSNSFAYSLINPENYAQWLTSNNITDKGMELFFKVDKEEVSRTGVLDLTRQQFDAEGDKVTHMSLSTYIPWEYNPTLPTWKEFDIDPRLDMKNLKDWTNEHFNAKYCEVNITMEKYPKMTFFGYFDFDPSSEGAVEDIAMDDFSIDIDGLTVKDTHQADELMLYDLNGRQVASGSGAVTAPASGIYILRIRKPSGITSVKLRL